MPSNASAPAPRLLRWWNLPLWAGKTLQNSLYFRNKPRRALTAQRLIRSLSPNLQQPIFIVGAARSGTSFLGDCFNALPEVSYHYEPVATKAAVRYVFEKEWDHPEAARFFCRVYRWLLRIYLDGDLRFADKTPRCGFAIDFLAETFPDAQFIHLIRDGRAATLSLKKKPWLAAASARQASFEPGGYPLGPYPRFWVAPERREEFVATSDTHRCCWAWRSFVEATLASARNLPPARYLEVRYEAVAQDPAREADRITRFLGITKDSSRRTFRQAVAKFNPGSLHSWKTELTQEDLLIIEREAGSLLQSLGYLDCGGESRNGPGDHAQAERRH